MRSKGDRDPKGPGWKAERYKAKRDVTGEDNGDTRSSGVS